ncbi:MAG TPA: hypothetical protein DCQ06_14080, partial [Myxococcales bacterium]|nr:hypothetical protein [Myxococcales bacterium]
PKSQKNCDDGNVCTTDSCNSKTGKCETKVNTGPCDDGSICTSGDSCIDGKCKPGLDGFTSTIAGNGSSAVKDAQGIKASFNEPRGLAADEKGGMYVADRSAHRIRYIDSKFNVTTVAGTGSYGFKDGAAKSAFFRYPAGLAYDAKKATLYIADNSNHCIRKMVGGKVSVAAGKCGTNSSYYGYKEGAAGQAKMYFPEGLALNGAGELHVADRANHVIRMYDGNQVKLLAGTPGSAKSTDGPANSAGFNSPTAVSVSSSGAVFIADTGNHRIRALRTDGMVITVAGSNSGFQDGIKNKARFSSPGGVLWTTGGILYVTDAGNHRIRKVLLDGTVTTFCGGLSGFTNGAAKAARFNYPRSLTRGISGSLFISDGNNRRIRKVDLGELNCSDDDPCTTDKCDASKGCQNSAIAKGKACEDGALCETGGTCNASGKCVGGKPKCTNGGPCVQAICETLSGACLPKGDGAACDDGDKCTSGEICTQGKCLASIRQLSVLSGSGGSATIDGTGTQASHWYPRGMDTDDIGTIYGAEYSGHKIRKITGQGVVKTFAGTGSYGYQDGAAKSAKFYYPCDVAWAPSGDLYVADRSNHRIRKIAFDGTVSTVAGSTYGFTDGAGATARFGYPESIAVDRTNNIIYVADSYNNRIRKVTPNGTVTTFIGSGSSSYKEGTGTGAWIYRPTGVAVGTDGTVYFSSYYHHMIRKATPAGKTSLLAGATSYGYTNGQGSAARFRYPGDIAVDVSGNVFVADRANHAIRKVTPSGTVTTYAGTGTAGMTNGVATTSKLSNPYGVAVFGSTVYVGDSSNNRIRAIRLPIKDCNDGNACTVDSCDAKTAQCSHKKVANCCAPVAATENFKDVAIASKMKFYTCQPQKFDVALKNCKEDTSGLSPKLGWQVASPALMQRTAPGALYYGSAQFGNYNWGPNAGKVITAPLKVPNTKKNTLRFWVNFDTETPATIDRLYAFLQVDGKRVLVGDGKAPGHGAAWYN